jgi:hypothetical protein
MPRGRWSSNGAFLSETERIRWRWFLDHWLCTPVRFTETREPHRRLRIRCPCNARPIDEIGRRRHYRLRNYLYPIGTQLHPHANGSMGRNPITRRLGFPAADEAAVTIGSRGDDGGLIFLFGSPFYRILYCKWLKRRTPIAVAYCEITDIAVAPTTAITRWPTLHLQLLRRPHRRFRHHRYPHGGGADYQSSMGLHRPQLTRWVRSPLSGS